MNDELRVVLDTNVFVSAAIRSDGPPGRLIRELLENAAFTLVLSAVIGEEVLRTLAYPKLRRHLRRDLDAADWLHDLLMLAELVPGELEIPQVCADPDDDKFIVAALEGRARFIVTGDRQLLAVERHEGVEMTGPRDFLARLGR